MVWKTILTAVVAFAVGCVLAFLLFRSALRDTRRRLKAAKTGTHPAQTETKAEKFRAFLSKIGTMNLILAFIFVSATVFTTVMVSIFLKTGMIPDTLVTCVFSFLGGECGFMAVIRSFKEKWRDRKNELEDRAYYESKSTQETQNQDKEGF